MKRQCNNELLKEARDVIYSINIAYRSIKNKLYPSLLLCDYTWTSNIVLSLPLVLLVPSGI